MDLGSDEDIIDLQSKIPMFLSGLVLFNTYAPKYPEGIFTRTHIGASVPSENLFTKNLITSLIYMKAARLNKRKELNKLPIIKDQKVESWIDSNKSFGELIGGMTEEIFDSTKDSEVEVKDIYIKDAHPSHTENELEEFVITITVPKGTDLLEMNKLWDLVGSKATDFIDKSHQTEPDEVVAELDKKLLIVVSEEE